MFRLIGVTVLGGEGEAGEERKNCLTLAFIDKRRIDHDGHGIRIIIRCLRRALLLYLYFLYPRMWRTLAMNGNQETSLRLYITIGSAWGWGQIQGY